MITHRISDFIIKLIGQTCTKLSQCLQQKVLPHSVSQHHDQFGAAEAVALLLQARGADDLSISERETDQLEIPAEEEQSWYLIQMNLETETKL